MTRKQQVFVETYLGNGYNATAAALASGYSPNGCSVQGCRLLKIPAIVNLIEKRLGAKIESIKRQRPNRPSQTGSVYLIKCNDFIKIGITKRSPGRRMSSMQVGLPFDLELVCSFKVNNYEEIEKELHAQYAEKHKRGEWYRLEANDIEQIKAKLKACMALPLTTKLTLFESKSLSLISPHSNVDLNEYQNKSR